MYYLWLGLGFHGSLKLRRNSDNDNFSKWKIEVQTNWDKAKIEKQLKEVAHYEA